MNATLALMRADLRRRRGSLVVLVVVASLAGGVVIASMSGAQRIETSMGRFIEATSTSDVVLLFSEPQSDASSARSVVAGVEGADRVSIVHLVAAQPEARTGSDFYPMLVPNDDELGRGIDVPRVVRGRRPNAGATTEVALSERSAKRLGVDVGDDLPMRGWTEEGLEAFPAPDPAGPQFSLQVVGIVRLPPDLTGRDSDLSFTVLSAALLDGPGAGTAVLATAAFVRLEPGVAPDVFVDGVRSQRPDLNPDPGFSAGQIEGLIDPTLSVVSNGVRVFAAVVALAALLIVGQLLSRTGRDVGADDRVIAALGATSAGLRMRRLFFGLASAVVAGAIAPLVGFGLSGHVAFGIAARTEPDPGPALPLVQALMGAGAVMAVVGLVAAMTAWRSAERSRARAGAAGTGARRLVPRLVSVGGAEVATGVSWAAAGGPSGTGGGVWPARLTIGASALGLVIALTFGASLDHLLTTPRAYGWPWDALLSNGRSVDEVEQEASVAYASEVVRELLVNVDGVPAYGVVTADGAGRDVVLAAGSPPLSDSEVAVGASLLSRLDADIGDTVSITAGGSDRSIDFRIVGQAVAPVSSDGGSPLSGGVALTDSGMARLGVDDCGDGVCTRSIGVSWVPGADRSSAIERLIDEEEFEWSFPEPPAEVARLGEVRSIPWAVASVLVALAIAATTHASVATGRRRRHEIAVLRAAGMTTGQVRRAFAVFIGLTAVGAAGVGAVVGALAARRVWTVIAEGLGIAPRISMPLAAVALVLLLLWLGAHLAALVPARSNVRIKPAPALRSL